MRALLALVLLVLALLVLVVPTARAQTSPPSEPSDGAAPSDQVPPGETTADETTAEADPDTETDEGAESPDTEAHPEAPPEATPPTRSRDGRASPTQPDDEELFEVRSGSPASTAFGVLTVVAAVASVASLAVFLERSNSADVCDGYASEDPVSRGCINGPAIAEQRDISVGLLIGFGAATVVGAVGWILATVLAPSEPPTAAATAGLRCAPGGPGLRCTF